MAAINVVLNGVFTTDAGATNGSFVGQMAYSDRHVGGGPIVPPAGPVDPGYGYPEKPVDPGYGIPERPRPPSDAHPEHPIVNPPTEPPTGQPDSDGFVKVPPEGGWGYHQTYQWLYNPAPGEAGPK